MTKCYFSIQRCTQFHYNIDVFAISVTIFCWQIFCVQFLFLSVCVCFVPKREHCLHYYYSLAKSVLNYNHDLYANLSLGSHVWQFARCRLLWLNNKLSMLFPEGVFVVPVWHCKSIESLLCRWPIKQDGLYDKLRSD